MILRDIDFGRVWSASGVQGFFGEGYWFHKWLKPLGLDFKGATFVSKTTTLNPRRGNMPLDGNFAPKELFPRCVVVKPLRGIALNSVGLSGPGAKTLFEKGAWQEREKPFFVSFMAVGETPLARIEELSEFVNLFRRYLPAFNAPVGLQMNYSCPNVGIETDELVEEVAEGLSVASILGIPLVPKFSVTLPVEAAALITSRHNCDALCISNTIPWGQLKEHIDWKKLFGTEKSPLVHLGGGGLSGKPLLPLVADWVRKAKHTGLGKPVNASGGILSQKDATMILGAGADSISLGSIAFLRPWRVKGIISTYE